MNPHPHQPFTLPLHPQNTSGFPFPVDPTSLAAFQPFMVQSEHRRKNATREVTAPLKHWLNQHRKNPYPTKAEKTFLALLTHMTMTQVSTWFANARRRLKKESGNMSWAQKSNLDDDLDEGDKEEVEIDNEENHQQNPGMSGIFRMMANGGRYIGINQQNLIGQHLAILNEQQRLFINGRILNESPSSSTPQTILKEKEEIINEEIKEKILLNGINQNGSVSPPSTSSQLQKEEKEEEENEEVKEEKTVNGTEKRPLNRKRALWSITDILTCDVSLKKKRK